MKQTRLAGARLGHDSDDLTVSRLHLFGRMLEYVHLVLTTNEPGQATHRSTLKPGTKQSQPSHLEHLDRLTYPFHCHWAERLEREVSFAQLARSIGHHD